jgi:DNA-binding NtrC family response regulator
MRDLLHQAAMIAKSDGNVMITGETGVGKDHLCRVLHANSSRGGKPLVGVNCAAIPHALFEGELFGHVRGAFTGADRDRRGFFQRAHGGTFHLDEFAEAPPEIQAKLLRVIETGEVQAVGAETPEIVDVRVVASTNRDIGEAIRDGSLREDLYHRLSTFRLDIPPLRERREDIAFLAEHFIREFCQLRGREPLRFSPSAAARVYEHSWPGNVRELLHFCERVVAMVPGPCIETADVETHCPNDVTPASRASDWRPCSLKESEAEHITRVLAHVNGHRARAAGILGIAGSTLWSKMKRYGIE